MLKLANSDLMILILVQFSVIASLAVADDPPEVAQIAQTAINAQNAGEYELAAGQWEQLIADYPDSSRIGVALYNAGYCHVQTSEFVKAADRLEQAIKKLDSNSEVALSQSYLFLGFSQSKLGRELLAESPQEARQWLTTATQTFVTLLNRFPDFKDSDQALFFQADAFEALERTGDAAKSYEKMLEYEKPFFKLDGMFALAFIRGQQGKYDEAYKLYTQFSKEGAEHPAFNEVQFRAAESLVELGKASENRGDTDQASQLFSQAAGQFESVFRTLDPKWADDAKFEQASILHRQGKFPESAKAFEIVIGITGSELADRARVYAGRDYLKAGNVNAAIQVLEKAVSVPSPFAAEAAHWLSQLYLQTGENEKAFLLTKEWIAKTQDEAVKVPLMLGQADAAYAINSRRGDSKNLYLAITNSFPNNRLAATALYNAAYAAMETEKFEDAISLTRRFKSEFSDSDYLPDVLEVEADSFLLLSKPDQAEATLGDLIAKFSNHPKSSNWVLRSGLALYLQKKYTEVISRVEPVVAQLNDPDKTAEAFHWIGSSYYQLGETEKAIKNLQDSFATSKKWRRADETLLTLSRAFYENRQPEEAKQVTQRLVQLFPKSPLLPEASYRLGEFEYDAGNYKSAIENYSSVVEDFNDSQFAPYAMYGMGWSQLQLSNYAEAVTFFTELIKTFPQHNLSTDVLVGRASANRQQGKLKEAIADAESYLSIAADKQTKKEEATYELGLAQIALKDWDATIRTFEQLLGFAGSSKLADRYHYELAWAYKTRRSDKDDVAAVKNFGTIAAKWPKSPLASEANFHVAQSAYQAGQYGKSAELFQKCIDHCKDKNIQEKAIYKLAWSQYKQKDYTNALRTFRHQIEQHPDGQLRADALFMVSETLYEADKFGEALQEYKVAKPVIETSKTVSSNFKILTFLHGAQSANLAKEHQQAIDFAKVLVKPNPGFDVDVNSRREANMEIGDAYRALGEPSKAISAYAEAAKHPGKTGARSMFMIGEIYLDEKKFDEAINKFKLVWFGYGGSSANESVKPWQAFAVYEAARCNLLLASGSKSDTKLMNRYINESKKQFEYLVSNFPNDRLVPQAKVQLKKLN